MAFTAKDVQKLREMTGVGMMDCKKALEQTDGDMDKAVDFLREKGLATAAKKAGRIASDGVVVADVSPAGIGYVVEVNSETDFVAKNPDFQEFARNVGIVVAENDPADLDALLNSAYPGSGLSVVEMLREMVLKIGENLQVRRFARYDTGLSVAYIHAGGKIGVLVNLDVSDTIKANAEVQALGKDICMQIAAMRPQWLDRGAVPAEVIGKEKEILMAQTINEGKPAQVAEKIVAGRINKFYEENCLVDQAFVKENKTSVGKYTAQKATELGGTIGVKSFVRFEKGEGLQKREDNFAEEVAKMQG